MLEEDLNLAGQMLVRELVDNLIKDGSVATGKLVSSVKYKIIQKAEQFSIQILANKSLDFVNDGRKPNSTPPPIAPIIAWAKAKGVTPYKGMSYTQMGYMISKSIGDNGIVATNVVQRSIDNTIENIRTLIGNSAREEIVDLINKSFQ